MRTPSSLAEAQEASPGLSQPRALRPEPHPQQDQQQGLRLPPAQQQEQPQHTQDQQQGLRLPPAQLAQLLDGRHQSSQGEIVGEAHLFNEM